MYQKQALGRCGPNRGAAGSLSWAAARRAVKTRAQHQGQGQCLEVTHPCLLQVWEGAFLGTWPVGLPITGWGWGLPGERRDVGGMHTTWKVRVQWTGRLSLVFLATWWQSCLGQVGPWATLEVAQDTGACVCHTGPTALPARRQTPPPPRLQKQPSPWLWLSPLRLLWRPPQHLARPAPPQPPWQAPQGP